MPAFFWRVASGNYDPNDLTRWRGYEYEAAWQPDCDAGYDLGDNHGATWYVGAEDRYPDPKFSRPAGEPGLAEQRQSLAGDAGREAREDAAPPASAGGRPGWPRPRAPRPPSR